MFFRQLWFVGVTAIALGMTACQTTTVKEKRLVLAPGLFQSEDISRNSATRKYTKDEWVMAQKNGRTAGVVFRNGSARSGVFSRGKTLSIFSLRQWNRFKTADLKFGTESSIRTPLGQIPFLRFHFKEQECLYFRYLFGNSGDQQGRFPLVVSGYFCEQANKVISDSLASEFLHQVGVTGHYDPTPAKTVEATSVALQETNSTVAPAPTSIREITEIRPITVSWEGYSDHVAGTVNIKAKGGKGAVSMALPDGEGTCTGQYSYASNNTGKGSWAVACTNGLAASGSLKALGKAKGAVGEGIDTQGRKVKFTVGAKQS